MSEKRSFRRKRIIPILFLILLAVGSERTTAGCIVGEVVDAVTGEPINWGTVRILELNRAEPSHDGGRFRFCDVPVGNYRLEVTALGFRTEERRVGVDSERDTVDVRILLQETALQLDEVVVTARRDDSFGGLDPSRKLSGSLLQQELGGTLGATLANEPGVAQQSMGPATSRPVVRGVGGDRLTILEDGATTGDASSISADHAVAADPIGAERIEILRGPAAFLYSSNALGGVINVDRGNRTGNLPDQVHGNVTIQGESVNTGLSGGASLRIPLAPLALFLRGSYRITGDVRAGGGEVGNTDLETIDVAGGLRLPFSNGAVGVEGAFYRNHYGIPGGFVGAHPEGVRIEMQKRQFAADGEVHPAGSLFRTISFEGNYTNYYHRELEKEGVIGTEYGILTTSGAVRLHHRPIGKLSDHGVIGLQGSVVDLAANGVRIPQTDEKSLGLSLFEEKGFGDFSLSAAIRLDLRQTTPSREDSTSAGYVRERTFNGFSGGITTSWSPDFGSNDDSFHPLSLGLTLSRTWRTPSVEELFSDGPHLAAYSYEVGNAELEPEEGFNIELNAGLSDENGYVAGALFGNRIENYILPHATGETSFRTGLPLYRHTGNDVLLTGAELEFERELPWGLTGGGSLSWVRGEEIATNAPLPAIPPLNGQLSLRHKIKSVLSGVTARWSGPQRRTGEFEEPTDGYLIFDLFAQLRLNSAATFHTLILGVDNLLDTEYRNHLSRIRSVFPEPGRNLRLHYRLTF